MARYGDKGVYLYPDVLRGPFIVKAPEQKQCQVVRNSGSLLDLSRTLLDLAGIISMAKTDGISLVPALNGKALPKRYPLLFFNGWHVGVNFACGLEFYDLDVLKSDSTTGVSLVTLGGL